jgi:hypothetical protein
VLIFAGDQDFICNYMGLESMIQAMTWNGGTGLGVIFFWSGGVITNRRCRPFRRNPGVWTIILLGLGFHLGISHMSRCDLLKCITFQ